MEKLMDFNVDYDTHSGSSSLVLTREGLDASQLIDFQVEMMIYNKIPGLVPMEVRERDAHVELYYKLDGLVSLVNYLKKSINKVEFLSILDRLTSILNTSKLYFLDGASHILRDNYVYINPRSKEVFLIYIPISTEQDVIGALRTLIFNLVLGAEDIENQETLVKQVITLLKSDSFTVNGFSHLKEPDIVDSEMLLKSAGELGGELQLPQGAGARSRPNNLKRMVSGFAGLIFILLAVFTGLKMNWLTIKNWTSGLDYYNFIIALVILTALVALLLIIKSGRFSSNLFTMQPAAGINQFGQPEQCSNVNEGKVEVEMPFSLTACSNQAPDETVFLGSYGGPKLIGITGEEIILLNKQRVTLGRNKESCDYPIERPGIGRVHAQLKVIEGSCFIIDLDSKNGTYVNGEKLISNKDYRLNDNDRVSLANADYCFKS